MDPVLRFLYWNMNYHLEHHLYPTVPYHRLPDLHDMITDDLPSIYSSTIAAWREIVGAIRTRLWEDPEFYVQRELPDIRHAASDVGARQEGPAASSGAMS